MNKNIGEKDNIALSIVYDNNKYDSRFKLGFGFSCVVKQENNYFLFDKQARR